VAIASSTLIGVLIWWEWNRITRAGVWDLTFYIRVMTILVIGLAFLAGYPQAGAIFLAGFIVLAALASVVPVANAWLLAGGAYALAFLVPTVLLRESPTLGVEAILFLFTIVWTTDTAAYFSGRAIGGPKLWPAVSPKKTWAGFIGGTLGAMLAAAVFAHYAKLSGTLGLVIIAALLSVVSSGGDLFESWVKRRYDVKDSSNIIPGHGGYVAAATLALAIALLRGGFANPAAGLLQW
jgi:phosphatidate cytidylyltransferase